MTFIEALARQVPDFPPEKLADAFRDAVLRNLPAPRDPFPAFVGPMPKSRKRLPPRLAERVETRS